MPPVARRKEFPAIGAARHAGRIPVHQATRGTGFPVPRQSRRRLSLPAGSARQPARGRAARSAFSQSFTHVQEMAC